MMFMHSLVVFNSGVLGRWEGLKRLHFARSGGRTLL